MGCVLITGATGFLGRQVCRLLAARSAVAIVAVGRSKDSLEALADDCNHALLETALVDLRDVEQTLSLADRWPAIDRVIHLASPVPSRSGASMRMLADGMQMTASLVCLLDRLEVRHVVHISSTAVYGIPGDLPPTEDRALDQQADAYGLMKQSSENIERWIARQRGHRLAVLRPTQVYGPEEPHGLGITRMIQAAVAGQELTLHNGGEDERDLIFVDDAARLVVQATERETEGTFNVSTGSAVKMRDLARHVARASGQSVPINVHPCTRPPTRYVYPNHLARATFPNWSLTTIEEGVRRTVAAASPVMTGEPC